MRAVHEGRPPAKKYNFQMPFERAVVMVLVIMRHNLAQQVTGDLFGISQPTVSRIWRYLYPIIGEVTGVNRKDLAQALAQGIVIIDGTPIPTGNRAGTGTTNWNTKHHKQAYNIQVAAGIDGTLSAVSAPVQGSRHDSRALEEVGWAAQIAEARKANPLLCVLLDSAYVKHSDLAVRRKPAGKERSQEDKAFNKAISHWRVAVERTNAHIKQWKTLATGYRGPLKELPAVIETITNLEFYRQAT
jgi:hypothetical protein